ncbi:MAG: DUF4355 domain-containing protein [Atopobiaceae bacterium]|nr:DUF4355 domain-containing protein [Atopobiaceae bacterium]
MKRETVLQKLQEVQDGDYAKVLDFIMDENGKDVNTAKSPLKAKDEKIAALEAELKALQDEKEKAEQATLSKEELLQRQLDAVAKKQAELDTKTNRVGAAARLQEQGITGEQAEKILNRIVSADATATNDTVTAFLEAFAAQKAAVEAATKKSLLGSTPTPQGNAGSTPAMTREQFAGMTYQERAELYKSQPELYAQLTKQGE